jgi:4-amino-4-deoxy-L-arabinose transferase-like glycosyltransferase
MITAASRRRSLEGSRPARRARLGLLLVLGAVGVLWFGFLELRGLYFPDEGRYAEIPREMLATGDWVTPRLNGIPYFEKPPLQYWATAATFAVASADEWTTRLWPASAGLLTVIGVLLTARRLFSRRAGWMAATVLGSCWGYFLGSQFVTLDMTLTAFMTGALCAFLVAQDARTGARGRRRFMLLAWALCALGVLTKGVVGIALPVLALGLYIALTRDFALLKRLTLRAGLALFLAIAAPWFVLVELRNPGFAEFFFVREHLMRYTQPVHHRVGPWWYFVPVAIAFLMPWLPAIVAALWHDRTRAPRTAPAFDAARFAWCSAAAILVFFSLSSSKLPAYIMPGIGAVALAAAVPLARRFDATLRHGARTLVVAGGILAVAVLPALQFVKVPIVRADLATGTPWIVVAVLAMIGGGLLAWHLQRRGRRLPALAAVALSSLVACQAAAVLAAHIDDYFSSERLIERLTGDVQHRAFRPDLPFYSVDMFDHTVPFYLGRTVTLVREQGELAWGISHAPANYIATLEAFEQRWTADTDGYAIMTGTTYEELRAKALPMRLVDRDSRRVIVARR